jgi:DNA-binding transcriptional MocR family regulator
MTTLQNPLGATLPEEKKRELVKLLERHDVALIEDDVYGDLYDAVGRHKSAKTYDRKGIVLHCGSFSKSLAPGYRLGWVAAGKYSRGVQERKMATTLATSMPIQLCISKMLREGGYDAHLAKLRTTLAKQQTAALASLRKHLPRDYRVSAPQGGYFLWIELAPDIDALELHRAALERNISLAPGPIFSARREFRNFIRLNCGHPWNERMDRAIAEIGSLIRAAG